MARVILAFSSDVLNRNFRAGDIDKSSLDASFFAFYLQRQQVSYVLCPELMTIVEKADREGRVHWRDFDYEVETGDWIRAIIRMLEANGVEVEDVVSYDCKWTLPLLERALADSGVDYFG
jgi:hypothetical protein